MVGPGVVRLPDGQRYTVKPVFAGLQFQSQELNETIHAFPIGWTIVLRTEDEVSDHESTSTGESMKKMRTFRAPTLQSDCLFISSISNPSNDEYKPAASPTRQIAMILWITLYWYFHQHEPKDHLLTEASKHTPDVGKPRSGWLINIRRDGVLRGRNLIPKLERMGLIMSYNSAVGSGAEDDGWDEMFVSRRMFWQIPGRLFLFTLAPNRPSSFPGSPVTSRPTSPVGNNRLSVSPHARHLRADSDLPGGTPPLLSQPPSFPIGPFYSSSHLPTYYPPMPPLYTMTDNIRHPVRPKPPRMGEVFYTRFVPSMNQYLSFRVASSSPKPVPYWGPIGPKPPEQAAELLKLSDAELLQKWLASKRVKAFWGDYQPDFLTNVFSLKHSFPAIGLWDGVPFGYFEIYWVREDILGKTIGAGEQNDWDRGLHVLVGEEWSRGRVPYWLSSLVHWCLTVDYRTMTVCSEPRIDNQRFVQLLQNEGFAKEKQVTFPHKQSWFMKLRRDAWEGPNI